MPAWKRSGKTPKKEERSEKKPKESQVYVLFDDGTTLETSVGTGEEAASYEQIIEQIATADGMVQVTEVVMRNMAAFDSGWWGYLDRLIRELKGAGRQEFARQGINTGKFVCDHVLMYGTMEQLLAASRWWNQYLVTDVVEQVGNVQGEEETEQTIREALQVDADISATYMTMLEILSKRQDSRYAYLQKLTESNLNWLDDYFFEGLSRATEVAERQGKKELAWRYFVAGAIAGSTLFNHHSFTQLGRAVAFLDQFPEQRYR